MEQTQTITCIAVDDEPFALKIIEDFCRQIPWLNLLKTFNNPVEAFSYLQTHQPDVAFLDIKMPDISGIQLAEQLQELPFVIFTTAFSQYAVKSYNLDAIDYLLKPFDFNRFFKAVLKAQKHMSLNVSASAKNTISDDTYLQVKIEYKNVKIKIADILYLESMDNYVKIFTSGKYYMPHQNLKSIHKQLPQNLFLRVHKSYIVSKQHISRYTHKEIHINDVQIPIGRTYLARFVDAMK
ncbi:MULTISPECIES: LytR/AlgR family response regulator transcription factor [unclassified Saccharicrinis]|uniref:LytR/AlgR family response regulator transcription factor n=1 Tax=unclassified Saccharicrinis TaxID=2646859 RepID=UPI003D335303